ncbi:MAG: hypothetical protein M1829_004134 [Trizodia sp. TS-e1964]|nr:MAG: hypothetical protein M1829_004134 [Trizodia sp. TS-e1964]
MDIRSHPVFQPHVDPASKDERTHFPLEGQDFSSVSDETLVSLFETAPVVHSLGGTKIVRISRTLALKGGPSVLVCEAANLKYAAAHTNITLPKVHRVFNIGEHDGFWGTGCFFVMDFVQGPTVAECWKNVDEACRLSIISQVADMIQQMQSVIIAIPGPIGGGCRFRGIWFSDYGAGPFNTLQELTDWFNHKLEICNRYHQSMEGTPEFAFQKLLLTHQDITPRNLILDREGQVWLVDWAYSGGYPPGFEQAALSKERHFKDFSAELGGDLDSTLPPREYAIKSGIQCSEAPQRRNTQLEHSTCRKELQIQYRACTGAVTNDGAGAGSLDPIVLECLWDLGFVGLGLVDDVAKGRLADSYDDPGEGLVAATELDCIASFNPDICPVASSGSSAGLTIY